VTGGYQMRIVDAVPDRSYFSRTVGRQYHDVTAFATVFGVHVAVGIDG